MKAHTRERVVHELREFVTVFFFLAPFFLAFEAYRLYLEGNLREPLLAFGMALFNALVLSKVILIGEMAHLGEFSRGKPLHVVTIHKSAVFTVLYSLFHLLERGIHGLLHGESLWKAVQAEIFVHGGGLALRLLVLFFALIPFFALRELRRVIGEEQFQQLFLGSGRHSTSSRSATSRRNAPGPRNTMPKPAPYSHG
jgi:hypothetical protein